MSIAVVSLVKEKSRRRRISKHVHQFCRDNFAYSLYMKKLLALLEGLPAKEVANGFLKRQAWYHSSPKPSISVIVPNYNYGRYLELRLRTILDQTLSPSEIIVLDDASTDYSLDIIQSIAESSTIPIKLIKNNINTGNPFIQWVKGIEQATGELIWIAEADDYCEPNLLEILAEELLDDSVVMAWGDSCIVDDKGHGEGFAYKSYYAEKYGEFWHRPFKIDGKQLIDKCLVSANVLPNASAVLFRRHAVEKDLSMIQQYRFSGDWWLWISLAEKGKVAYRTEILNYHRLHSQSIMGDILRQGDKLIPETMEFYLRLAKYKPNIFSAKIRISVFQSLENMYQLFPTLTQRYPQLNKNPLFQAQYQMLVEQLEPVKALEKRRQRMPATLVISQDVMLDTDNVFQLINYFLEEYELQFVLFSEDHEAEKLFISNTKININSTKIISVPFSKTKNKRVNHIQSLKSTLKKEGHIISYGLFAHVIIEQQWRDTYKSEWTLVAGNEFDILLGSLSEGEHINRKDLGSALKHCTESYYISEAMPYALARMVEPYARIIERLDLNEVKCRQTYDDSKKDHLLVKVAASLSERQWVEEVSLVEKKRKKEKIDYRLRFLVMGYEVESLQSIVKGKDFVELVWIYEKQNTLLRKWHG